MCRQGQLLRKTCPHDACVCFGICGQKNVIWQTHYEPSFSCTFEERVGQMGDGGKWVCDPHRLSLKAKTKEGCLVYSIGSNGNYGFEEGVHESISDACEIHTIDMNNWTRYTNQKPPKYVDYHIHTIGPEPSTPIPKLVDLLGHRDRREIDILKIDCEGCEWSTYEAWFDAGLSIRQILVEVHNNEAVAPNVHKFFKHLFDVGYMIFHKEANVLAQGTCIEYAFLKLTPEFSRGQAP